MPKRMDAFYVPDDFEITLKELKEILKREGKSFSEWIRENAETYVNMHRRGNPQLLITHYAKPEEPQPMRVLCIYCQGALTDGRVFCQKRSMWVPGVSCYSCRFNQLRNNR